MGRRDRKTHIFISLSTLTQFLPTSSLGLSPLSLLAPRTPPTAGPLLTILIEGAVLAWSIPLRQHLTWGRHTPRYSCWRSTLSRTSLSILVLAIAFPRVGRMGMPFPLGMETVVSKWAQPHIVRRVRSVFLIFLG